MIKLISEGTWILKAEELRDSLFNEHSIIALGQPRNKIYSRLRRFRNFQNEIRRIVYEDKNIFRKVSVEEGWLARSGKSIVW